LTIRDIDLFASASGPGSFTGVRVGLTAIKGLAEATGRKAIAISNLQTIASFGSARLRAVAIDARRGEIFGAVYDDQLRIVCPEVVTKFESWLAAVQGEAEFITNGYEAPFPRAATQAPRRLAGAIGKIAAERIGQAQDPAAIDANYVRRSDAELYWKE
jgi:tRNA threonylcarbamoyladenosine biosynthesis protein TsaB